MDLKGKMLDVYKIKDNISGKFLNVIRIKYPDYYKVFVKDKEGNVVMSFKFSSVDDLTKAFIKSVISYCSLVDDFCEIIDE